MNELLDILRSIDVPLPKDVRTLKQTPKDAETIQIDGGTYIHYGLEDALTDFISISGHDVENIELDFNIDGLPISKSSNKQIWPILCSVVPNEDVLLVGVYEGYTKPKCVNEYLSPLISEIKNIISNGLTFNFRNYNVSVRCFIMDTPARSFVLSCKGHTGYYSCIRCTQKGEYINHRLVFPANESAPSRTNESFRGRIQREHHNNLSPTIVEQLNIDIVNQFILDYMHIICLGVVRTLLNTWVKVRGEHFSIPNSQIKLLSKKLIDLKNCIPREFARKPRSILDLDRSTTISWKATELRQFLLYTGPFVLQDIVALDLYEHFLKLSIATRILLDETTCISKNDYAKTLMNEFVRETSNLYNPSLHAVITNEVTIKPKVLSAFATQSTSNSGTSININYYK
ncbi:hypothetical protein CVS40_9025 [Lucilia cuprina]|nr:hypothetical protein CVS40_9025 [Lucilia cuprina]